MIDRIKNFFKSLRHACDGLKHIVRNEKNFQYDILAALIVIIGIIHFGLSRWEVVVLFLVMAGVLMMELFNTVVERMVDMLKPRIHPYAKLVKDLMAAGVLLASLFAVIIGIIIFLPHIVEKIR